jgi:hypothetical protein
MNKISDFGWLMIMIVIVMTGMFISLSVTAKYDRDVKIEELKYSQTNNTVVKIKI